MDASNQQDTFIKSVLEEAANLSRINMKSMLELNTDFDRREGRVKDASKDVRQG